MAHPYEDILHLPRPVAAKGCPMTDYDRAAQFSPFAALTGFDACIGETARLTDSPVVLDDCRKEELNRILQQLQSRIGERPEVVLTHFVYDERKAGGAYVRTAGRLKKMDAVNRRLLLEDGRGIWVSDVIAIEVL